MQNVEAEKTVAEYIQDSLICQPNGYENIKFIGNKILIDNRRNKCEQFSCYKLKQQLKGRHLLL